MFGFTYLPLIHNTSGKLVNALARNEQLHLMAGRTGGVFRTSDLKDINISAYEIRKLIEAGTIERIKPGYYYLLSMKEDTSESALIAKLFPDGVLCMHTALFYYQYSDRTPLAWDIAIDKDTSKSRFKLDYPYVQPYYLEPKQLSFGITSAKFEDCTIKIFDRDRLICECIYYERKIDRETYNKAIQGYVHDTRKSVTNLLDYANKRRVLKKVKDRIGVWL